ncbi:MAG: transcriptional regulator [Candidatus Bathyarchaeota archaeon]|nr:transcriptional regulator [Candidatus Bathyarchaeota archaeon]
MSEPETGPDKSPMMKINRLIHEPARFSIMAQLSVVEEADFLFLSRRIGLTRGNLSAHMRKLEDEGYIEVRKGFMGRRPHTVLAITEEGHKAFKTYLMDLKNALQAF